MSQPETLLWDRITIAKTGYGDIAGALGELDCQLCGKHQGWLDIADWQLRQPPNLFPGALLRECVYMCKGCLKKDGDSKLWTGAVALALQRTDARCAAGILTSLPVFVSVVPPDTRQDNHRCRWLEFLQ